jgi:hypothetical protein
MAVLAENMEVRDIIGTTIRNSFEMTTFYIKMKTTSHATVTVANSYV